MKVKIGDRNGTGEMSRGGAAGMGGERSMGGKGAHLGDLGWPAGRGSSRGLSHPILRIKLNALNSCVPRDQSHT